MRILLVEDARQLRESLGLGLRKAGYAVDASADGEEGLWLAESNPYDVIILDLMLPKLDGLSVLKRLREQGLNTHVLILTARETVADRVQGLKAGADDYLTKPFALEELLARVEALIRRGRETKNPALAVGDLTIDTGAHTVSRNGRSVALTPREYAVLEFLAHRQGQPVSRTDIEEHIYDENADLFSNVVDSTICTLRKKLQDAGCPPVIHTRRGLGYVLDRQGS